MTMTASTEALPYVERTLNLPALRSCRDANVNLEPDQLGREIGKPFGPYLRRWELKSNVLAIHITEFAKPLPECLPEVQALGDGTGRKNTYPRHVPRLLRAGRER